MFYEGTIKDFLICLEIYGVNIVGGQLTLATSCFYIK